MSITLFVAMTAAVAATMGYMAARRRADEEPDEEQESPPKDGSPASKKKVEPKPRPSADPKAAFAGMPLALGDVVSAQQEERWLAGALVAREEGRVLAALFLAPEGKRLSAVAAFAPPRREIFWMEPVELLSPEEPPATIELAGGTMRRKGRLPVTLERLGQGAPPVAEEAIWAAYEGSGRDVAVVITSQGQAHAWMGKRLDEEEYDRLGEG
jgi:hypothetical protein